MDYKRHIDGGGGAVKLNIPLLVVCVIVPTGVAKAQRGPEPEVLQMCSQAQTGVYGASNKYGEAKQRLVDLDKSTTAHQVELPPSRIGTAPSKQAACDLAAETAANKGFRACKARGHKPVTHRRVHECNSCKKGNNGWTCGVRVHLRCSTNFGAVRIAIAKELVRLALPPFERFVKAGVAYKASKLRDYHRQVRNAAKLRKLGQRPLFRPKLPQLPSMFLIINKNMGQAMARVRRLRAAIARAEKNPSGGNMAAIDAESRQVRIHIGNLQSSTELCKMEEKKAAKRWPAIYKKRLRKAQARERKRQAANARFHHMRRARIEANRARKRARARRVEARRRRARAARRARIAREIHNARLRMRRYHREHAEYQRLQRKIENYRLLYPRVVAPKGSNTSGCRASKTPRKLPGACPY